MRANASMKTVTIELPARARFVFPDNYVRPVALPGGGWGLFVGFDENFASNPLDGDRLFADPDATGPAPLPPWSFGTLGEAEATAKILVDRLRDDEDRRGGI